MSESKGIARNPDGTVSLKELGVDEKLDYTEIRTNDGEIEHRKEELFPGENPELRLCVGIRGNTAGHVYTIIDFVHGEKRYVAKIDGRLFFVPTTFKFSDGWKIEDGIVIAYERIPEKHKARIAAWLDEMRPLVEERSAKRRNEFKSKNLGLFLNIIIAVFSMVTGIFTFFYRKVRDLLFGKKLKKEIIKGPTCVAVMSAILFDVAGFDKVYKNKPWFPADLLRVLAKKGLCSDGVKLEPKVFVINSRITDAWNNLPRWKNMWRYIGKVLIDRRTWGI